MLTIFRKPESKYPINPRFRAYGKARIDIAKRANTRADWDHLWKKPSHPFPFSWGNSWKQCVEYKVADFAAEVGFFIDILGFPVNAFDPDYAMFTSPSGDFYFSVVPTRENELPTPNGAIRLQFMVQDILATAYELERRGVKFDQLPARVADNSSFLIGCFHTPNGIDIELWGFDSRSPAAYSTQPTVSFDQELESEKNKNTDYSASPENQSEDAQKFTLSVDLPADEGQFHSNNRRASSAQEPEYLNEDDL